MGPKFNVKKRKLLRKEGVVQAPFDIWPPVRGILGGSEKNDQQFHFLWTWNFWPGPLKAVLICGYLVHVHPACPRWPHLSEPLQITLCIVFQSFNHEGIPILLWSWSVDLWHGRSTSVMKISPTEKSRDQFFFFFNKPILPSRSVKILKKNRSLLFFLLEVFS